MRYSIPAKLVTMMWTDNDYFNSVLKASKVSIIKFPKTDEWIDEEGFHLEFALAGYSVNDVVITTCGQEFTACSRGISDEMPEVPEISSNDDSFKEYSRQVKPKVHKGLISRGIARRSFKISLIISDEFDCTRTIAVMEHGLLHVKIPQKDPKEINEILTVNIMEKK